MSGPDENPGASVSLDALRAEIARVRASGALGESGRLRDLFEFLAARADNPVAPKETEIAVTVFGKPAADGDRDDPVARVYVHRLRKRLDEFYRREGAPEGVRLEIPRGAYRLAGRATGGTADAPARARFGPVPGRRALTVAAITLAAFAALNIAAWALLGRNAPNQALQRGPVWGAISASERPLLIVVGDYYVFGEYEQGMFLRRLVRDFAINSREDLQAWRMDDPDAFERYTDVNLEYIPISVAFALGEMMPAIPADKQVRVSLASDLTAEAIKDNDILYVGLLSGMAMLREPAFAASRFQIGSSFDELIDAETGRSYVSESFAAAPENRLARDYGYFASFPGPSGNHVIIVAGARDAAVGGAAEWAAEAETLARMREAAGGAGAFEALLEIEGVQHVSLDGRLIAAAPLDPARIWSAETAAPRFPDE